MKILKVIYDDDVDFILDIVNKIDEKIYVEKYNITYLKDLKKAIPIMTRHGTKAVPLIVFENENLEEYAAIWSESNPNWLEEINKILKE